MRVLLVEDDVNTKESIELMLKASGMVVDSTDLGEDGLEIGKLYDYDIIILDIMLPDMNGFEVLRRLRDAKVRTPVLILSGLTESENKVKGLGSGADDYLTKPFEPEELLARIHAIFRRTSPLEGELIQSVCFGNVTLKMPERSIVRKGHSDIALTSAEFDLLLLFLTHAGQPLTREEIAEKIGTKLDASSRTIDVRISRLRNRLGDHKAILIQTIRNEGYILSSKVQPLHSH